MSIISIINLSYFILFLLSIIFIFSLYSIFNKNKKINFIAVFVLLSLVMITSAYLFFMNTNIILLNLFHLFGFSLFFIFFFSFLFILILILSFKRETEQFYSLLGLVIIGVLLIPIANSLITIFLALELISISTSFLILSKNEYKLESAIKLFLLSAISIAIFAFAMVLIFPYNSQLSLTSLVSNNLITSNYFVELSIILFIVALGFESALFPFNFWVPDVYQGSESNITALISGINKSVAFIAIILILFIVFSSYRQFFSMILFILAILTMFFGNLLALVQKNVKRLFAYSSISQAGYILIGLAAVTQYGLEASTFQIVAHAFMIIGVFSIIFFIQKEHNLNTIEDYNGLSSRNGFAAISLTILMLSMAGIPPLLGFYGKFLLFSSAISANMLILAIIGILNSFISIYYYGKLITSMYRKREVKQISLSKQSIIVVSICLIIIIGIGIYPQPLIHITRIISSMII